MRATASFQAILCIVVLGVLTCCLGNQNQTVTNIKQECQDDPIFTKIIQKLTVVHAKAGRYDDARKELKLLKNYTNEIKPIVSLLYSKNSTSNADHLVGLLKSNLSCPAFTNGLESWFENLQKYNHSSEPEVLLLAYTANKFGCDENEKLGELRVVTEPLVDNILSPWVAQIRNGSGPSIYPFIKSSENRARAVRLQMPKMIKEAFSGNSTEYLKSALNFTWNLPYLQDVVVAYSQIVTALKGLEKEFSEEMLLASYWIHRLMTNNAKTIEKVNDLKESFSRLKNDIPAAIQHIFWRNKGCSIKNLDKNEYLVGTETKWDYSGEAFTTNELKSGRGLGWDLIPHMVEGQLVFVLMNNGLRRHRNLCQKYSEVKTCNHEYAAYGPLHDQWIFKPTERNGTENAFIMQNSENKRTSYYMLASDSFKDADRNDRRRVFTSGSDGAIHWTINCS